MPLMKMRKPKSVPKAKPAKMASVKKPLKIGAVRG
jgi:hypothetical protein